MSKPRLRWFQTYNNFGYDSEMVLQVWDEYMEDWVDINTIRVNERDEHEYNGKDDM